MRMTSIVSLATLKDFKFVLPWALVPDTLIRSPARVLPRRPRCQTSGWCFLEGDYEGGNTSLNMGSLDLNAPGLRPHSLKSAQKFEGQAKLVF